ncbi:hypothetical protein A2392_00075 [Candidatus Kaiserbacteria bacterium RIFOXYB1_FULL_46_14]|uniref:Uncharacterized protein n=1 Tax=Candidatus Kaiserbacteria bacterium RIFOXYB1_FULL_46_14 TaxID=1798531 RepID=A0A1F6FHW9_9BACT|nr:MAG: hypothetical protein A2392_00075 [Candidatus Kaiserbacteria bacterium RIFOXYB1_FULL_46_14]
MYHRLIGRWNSDGFKRYTANTSWALFSRVLSIVVAFFVTIYLVRYLGPENYGQLSYAVSFVGLFSIISTLGIDNILYRDLIRFPEKRNAYLGSALIIKLWAGSIAAALTIAIAFIFSQDDVSQLIILMLSGTFIFNAFNVVSYEFQANVAQKYISVITFIVVIVLNVLKLMVIFLGGGILYIGIILLFEAVLYAVLLIYIRIQHYGSMLAWYFDKKIAVELLRDSWPFIFIAAFTTIYVRIDQVMLKPLVDSSAVGLYDAAVRIAEVWLFVPAIIASSLFPAIVNAKAIGQNEYKKRLILLAMFMVSIGVAIALPLSLFAEPLMVLLYGPAFAASATVFAVYVWAGVWASLDIVTRYFLIAENRRVLIFTTSFLTAALNVLLNFYLIPRFGIVGAAWSTFISYAILALPFILIVRLQGQENNPPKSLHTQ